MIVRTKKEKIASHTCMLCSGWLLKKEMRIGAENRHFENLCQISLRKCLTLKKNVAIIISLLEALWMRQEEAFWSAGAVTTGRQREISSLTAMQNLTNVTDVTIKPTYLIRRKEKL